jgi:hypothetical protein
MRSRSPPACQTMLTFTWCWTTLGERLGRAWRETGEERTDRETVIADLIEGQYSNPARVVAFNTAEGWSRDISEEVADELLDRLAIESRRPCPRLRDSWNCMAAAGRLNCRCRCEELPNRHKHI